MEGEVKKSRGGKHRVQRRVGTCAIVLDFSGPRLGSDTANQSEFLRGLPSHSDTDENEPWTLKVRQLISPGTRVIDMIPRTFLKKITFRT